MSKFVRYCSLLLFSLPGVQKACAQDITKKAHIEFTAGYQQQNTQWSIAGNMNGENPNVLSELKWRNARGPSIGVAIEWNLWKRLLLAAEYNRSFIISGKVYDTDYKGENRTNAVYHATFTSDEGAVNYWAAGAGYPIFKNSIFTLTPYIGYNICYQSLHILDHTGTLSNLNSSYTTRWAGPFVKIKSTLRLKDKLGLTAGIGYSQVKYKARANWNLIEEFSHPVSFRHTANGYGLHFDTGLTVDLTSHTRLSMGAGYFTWQTGKGIDELYLVSGQTDRTQLNSVEASGYRLAIGLGISL